MRRTIYFGVFLLLSGFAGFFYYSYTREAPALVATHDLSIGTRIQDSDVTVRLVNPSSVGASTLNTTVLTFQLDFALLDCQSHPQPR